MNLKKYGLYETRFILSLNSSLIPMFVENDFLNILLYFVKNSQDQQLIVIYFLIMFVKYESLWCLINISTSCHDNVSDFLSTSEVLNLIYETLKNSNHPDIIDSVIHFIGNLLGSNSVIANKVKNHKIFPYILEFNQKEIESYEDSSRKSKCIQTSCWFFSNLLRKSKKIFLEETKVNYYILHDNLY